MRRRVSVIVPDRQGRVLVNDKPGDLEFPGGGIEEGESIEEAAIREVMEEAGLRPSNVESFGQRPTVAKGEKTYWRAAQGSVSDRRLLNAEGDEMQHKAFLPPSEVKKKIEQSEDHPEVKEDEMRAIDKVAGYQAVMKQAGLWDAISHTGRSLREAASPVLGQTKRMVERQDVGRQVDNIRRRAQRGGSDPNLAEQRWVQSNLTPRQMELWREFQEQGRILHDPGDPTFNPLF